MAAARSEPGHSLVRVRSTPTRTRRAVMQRVLRLSALEMRFIDLLRNDADLAERGVVPISQLFSSPQGYAARLPSFLAPSTVAGRLDRALELARKMPGASLVNRAAALSELGARAVLLGSADAMRRQAIEPILAALPGSEARVLDLDGGAGPVAALFRHRGVWLETWDRQTDLPSCPEGFDVVTGSFLMHDLERPAREALLRSLVELMRPGGHLVLVECLQRGVAPDLDVRLESLDLAPDYVCADVAEEMTSAGLSVGAPTPAFFGTVFVGTAAATRASRPGFERSQ